MSTILPRTCPASLISCARRTSVSGSASDLYLLLWNRRGPEGLETHGDPQLLELWRASVRVRWS